METKKPVQQLRIALRNCGVVNPRDIDDCIAHDAYMALGKCLFEMTPADVVQEVLDSGLRGRGGAGFPTGKKWQIAAGYDADVKYVICNADEGDPGAFMDRSILEGDPHSVLEAMAICGYAIGAHEGRIYIRAEYPLAVNRLEHAIEQATEYGLLGKNIMGTDFDFNIEITLGAGAFVCGEETALIESMEGKRGMPRLKPPFPAQKGYLDEPSNINNVETFANVPLIIRTPVIPGFNDSEDNIAQTAEFLKSLSNLSYYELLSYNPMGNDKRKRLGYPVPEITALPAARMRELARTAASAGIPVWLNGTQYHNIED